MILYVEQVVLVQQEQNKVIKNNEKHDKRVSHCFFAIENLSVSETISYDSQPRIRLPAVKVYSDSQVGSQEVFLLRHRKLAHAAVPDDVPPEYRKPWICRKWILTYNRVSVLLF